ncbi:MAG TPA: hypothetical protein VJ824_01955, partial [Bacillota bacterium]|nr:hypothetical protein [Bacillota bacterium]
LLGSASIAYPVNDVTISGDSTRFSVGDGYPNNITNAGYDVRNNILYLNFDLVTTQDVTGKTPTFSYYSEVFDGTVGKEGTLIGQMKDGSNVAYDINNPKSVIGSSGSTTVQVKNEAIKLDMNGNTTFPASHRIVITVKNVSTN